MHVTYNLQNCSCDNVPANDICNYCQMIKFYMNKIVQTFCVNREIFLYLNDLNEIDFILLNKFLKSLFGPLFYFSDIYNEVVISSDNPNPEVYDDFLLTDVVGKINLME